jgi:hypothetical protein
MSSFTEDGHVLGTEPLRKLGRRPWIVGNLGDTEVDPVPRCDEQIPVRDFHTGPCCSYIAIRGSMWGCSLPALFSATAFGLSLGRRSARTKNPVAAASSSGTIPGSGRDFAPRFLLGIVTVLCPVSVADIRAGEDVLA